jgi:CHAT domain-containing protein
MPVIDDNGRYLVDRFAVSYSPCASVFMELQSGPRSRHHGGVTALAVGDPVFSSHAAADEDSRLDETTLRGAVQRDATVLDRLPRLAHSAEEIDRVASLFNTRVLCQANASEAALDRIVASGELAKYDIVHIATHTLISGAPERCAFALSRGGVDGTPGNDGLIDATEIRLTWRLDADLVTLSGCQTAGTGFSRGEPLGIAQALFAAVCAMRDAEQLEGRRPCDLDADGALLREPCHRSRNESGSYARQACVIFRGTRRGKMLAPRLSRCERYTSLRTPDLLGRFLPGWRR